MNTIPLIQNADKQSINTSIIALKREALDLENLIAKANNTLLSLNDKIAELEGRDYLYHSDLTSSVESGNGKPVTSGGVYSAIGALDVPSVGGSGKYISAISETDGKISATASDLGNMIPVDTVTSGNMHSVTSNAVAGALISKVSQVSNINRYTFGYSENQIVPAETFVADFIRMYGEGHFCIKFGWSNDSAFYIKFGTSNFYTSGSLMIGYFETLTTWRKMYFFLASDSTPNAYLAVLQRGSGSAESAIKGL